MTTAQAVHVVFTVNERVRYKGRYWMVEGASDDFDRLKLYNPDDNEHVVAYTSDVEAI